MATKSGGLSASLARWTRKIANGWTIKKQPTVSQQNWMLDRSQNKGTRSILRSSIFPYFNFICKKGLGIHLSNYLHTLYGNINNRVFYLF